MRINHCACTLFAVGCFLVSSCSQNPQDQKSAQGEMSADYKESIQPQSAPAPRERQSVSSEPEAESKKIMTSKQETGQGNSGTDDLDSDKEQSTQPDFQKVFTPPEADVWGRNLAYTMSLTYRCDKFLDSRKQLIHAIPRYGLFFHQRHQ